jgi:glycine cleavage system H protein
MADVPQDYRFTRTHEWVKVDGDTATIGITDYAQNELGDITYLELPGAGSALRQSEPFGVVESVKAASDVYAPLDGEVIEENQDVVSTPEMVNQSPYGSAWLIKVRLSDPQQVEQLLDAAAYEKLLQESGGH